MEQSEYKELMEAYNKLEKECMQLKKKLEEVQGEKQKGKIWQPKIGEKYWIVNNFDVCDFEHENDATDQRFLFDGKCYPTKEKAEFEADREKYTRLFRQYVEQHSEPLDWEDNMQRKYSCTYDFYDKELMFASAALWRDAFQIYASSKEVLQEATDFIGEDNFKKYILEVEE